MAAAGAAITLAWAVEKCTQDPTCSGWGIPSWNLAHNGDSALGPGDLPTSGEGEATYVPPKSAHGSPVGSRGRGYADRDGNIWRPDRSRHGGDHWDVEHKNGTHTNVFPDGKILGANNFPRNPNR